MNDLESEFTNLDFEEDVYDELPDFCYVQLQGWMVKLAHKYELALNEMLIYAVIHSFSQDGVSSFRGSRDYLRLWAFCGRTSVFGKVKKLLDLNLIGREYVRYKGREFPTFFSYASRQAIKKAVEKTKEKSVQILNSKAEKSAVQFKNCTGTVQNLNGNSSEFGPNNNLNINLKNAAAFVSAKIKKLLGCNCYSGSFISEISNRLNAENFDEGKIDSYLDYVMEKVLSKKPDNISALFKKLVIAEDIIASFTSIVKEKEQAEETEFCPVCGGENLKGEIKCAHCEFELTNSFYPDEVQRARKIFHLPEAVQKNRDKEIHQVMIQYPVNNFSNIQNIKIRQTRLNEIDRKYGLIV